MPQLGPTILPLILLFSWMVFAFLVLPKASNFAFLDDPNMPTDEVLIPTMFLWEWL